MSTAFYDFIKDSPRIAYNDGNKKMFEKLGKIFLKEVGELFGGEYKVRFNAGGIGVSGDLSLMAMKTPRHGIVIYISEPTFGGDMWAMARSIKSMNDHIGGNNIWIPLPILRSPQKTYEHLNTIIRDVPRPLEASI